MLTMLGIPNCDTVKKARRYLEAHGIAFQFRDIRKQPLSEDDWRNLLAQDAEGRLINTRGPSFRKLGLQAAELDGTGKLGVLVNQPAAMKRPVMVRDGTLLSIGFSEDRFRAYHEETE